MNNSIIKTSIIVTLIGTLAAYLFTFNINISISFLLGSIVNIFMFIALISNYNKLTFRDNTVIKILMIFYFRMVLYCVIIYLGIKSEILEVIPLLIGFTTIKVSILISNKRYISKGKR